MAHQLECCSAVGVAPGGTRPSKSWGALRCWAERSAGPRLGGGMVVGAPSTCLGWAAFVACGRRWGDGYAASAATPLTSAHVSNARALAARYSPAVTWS